eukprot:6370635-Amphidinium_carterae.1
MTTERCKPCKNNRNQLRKGTTGTKVVTRLELCHDLWPVSTQCGSFASQRALLGRQCCASRTKAKANWEPLRKWEVFPIFHTCAPSNKTTPPTTIWITAIPPVGHALYACA